MVEPNYLDIIKVTDIEDGNLINSANIDYSLVDITNVGTYPVSIKVLDSDHNYCEKVINVQVIETDYVDENIVGNLSVNIDIDDVSQLQGKQIRLKKGSREYFAKVIGNTATFENVPVATYRFSVPETSNGGYVKFSESFVTINQNKVTTTNVKYTPAKDNILNLQYTFNIRNDANYTPLYADLTYVSDNNYNLKLEHYQIDIILMLVLMHFMATLEFMTKIIILLKIMNVIT